MGTSAFYVKPETSAERREYYQRLEQNHAAPLWEVLGDLIPAQPRPAASPALWRYQEMRALLLEAGRLITPQEAERRVLILENPSMPGTSLITQSVYSGLQLVDPGETTPTHRHVDVGDPLRDRKREGLYGGGRRADHHASRRFGADAVVDVSRSRKSGRFAGHLAGWSGCSDRKSAGHEFRGGLSGRIPAGQEKTPEAGLLPVD